MNDYSLADLKTSRVPDIPVPDALFHGWYGEAADLIGKRTWEVWAGLIPGVAALAHRNIHWHYYDGSLYGMSYILLLAPSGAGKSLPARVAQYIASNALISSAVDSGQGFAAVLTDAPLDLTKGATFVEAQGRTALLVLREWTRMAQMMKLLGSSLIEAHNEIFDAFPTWGAGSRSTRSKRGGRIIIIEPSLTIFGSTTYDSFAGIRQANYLGSGFFNRYMFVPGQSRWEEYTGQNYEAANLESLVPDWNLSYQWGSGQPLIEAYEGDSWERFRQYQKDVLVPAIEDPALHGWSERLHVHYHRLALQSAWVNAKQANSDLRINDDDVSFAEAYCNVFIEFIPWLMAYAAQTDPTERERRFTERDRAILASVRNFYARQNGKSTKFYRLRQLCQNLDSYGGYAGVMATTHKLAEEGGPLEILKCGRATCVFLADKEEG